MPQLPRLSLFLGKGGVGKTTVSSAYAVARAGRSPKLRVALLSSDPAHSLGDIFAIGIGDEFKALRVPGGRSLQVAQIDAASGLSRFLAQHRPELLDLLEQGTFFDREDIGPLLDMTLPGMAEMGALLRISELLEARELDEIVIDTAPMGHTLRLLELPQTFLRFLDFLELAGSRDQVLAATFGGKGRIRGAFVADWRAQGERLLQVLSSTQSQIMMVTSAEQFSLREIERSIKALAEMEPALKVTGFVLNRVPDGVECSRCGPIAAKLAGVKARLEKLAPEATIALGRDDGSPVRGAAQLKAFGEEVFYGKRRRGRGRAPRVPMPEFQPVQWPELEQQIGFSIGKGGVGKTTVAAAVGFVTAQRQMSATISVCSVDPAPSLDEVFATSVGEKRSAVAGRKNLLACEIDAKQEFQRWVQPLRRKMERAFQAEQGGLHVELKFEDELFASLLDIAPPGMDEIFAVLRIAAILEKGREEQLIVDMAPTGHALELLRTPARIAGWSRLLMKALAPHRKLPFAQELAVEVASLGQSVRGLERLLKSSGIWMVMLPEPLPDRETARLQDDLKKLGLRAGMLFINRVLVQDSDCLRCQRARAWQAETLSKWKRAPRQRIFIIPEFGAEISGTARLKKFTRSILEWR